MKKLSEIAKNRIQSLTDFNNHEEARRDITRELGLVEFNKRYAEIFSKSDNYDEMYDLDKLLFEVISPELKALF
jgi:hypothetical protein